MATDKHYYTGNGVVLERGSGAAHRYLAGIFAEAQERLDKIEYALIDSVDLRNERLVLEAVQSAVGHLREFHTEYAANLERYEGNIEASRLEAQPRLLCALRALRKRRF